MNKDIKKEKQNLIWENHPILKQKIKDYKGDYVVFDLETTGFSPITDDIIEIGAVKLNHKFEVIDRFQTFLNLDLKKSVPKHITELTGITTSDTKGGIKNTKALKDFMKFIDEAIIVAHNANFEQQFMNVTMLQKGIGTFQFLYFDTMIFSSLIKEKISSVNYEDNKLATCIDYFLGDYDTDSHHRADYDAEMTAKVLSEMIKLCEANKVNVTDLTFEELFTKSCDNASKCGRGYVIDVANPEILKMSRGIFKYCFSKNLKQYGHLTSNYLPKMTQTKVIEACNLKKIKK